MRHAASPCRAHTMQHHLPFMVHLSHCLPDPPRSRLRPALPSPIHPPPCPPWLPREGVPRLIETARSHRSSCAEGHAHAPSLESFRAVLSSGAPRAIVGPRERLERSSATHASLPNTLVPRDACAWRTHACTWRTHACTWRTHARAWSTHACQWPNACMPMAQRMHAGYRTFPSWQR